MEKKRSILSAEGYRRLAKNPFVDRKMLQFIRDRAGVASDAQTSPTAMPHGNRTPVSRKPVISDEAAKLIAAAIRAMMRE